MRKLPSAWSIVWTDSTCYQLALIAPTFFLFALLVKLTGTVPGSRGRPDRPVDPAFALLALACTGAFLAFAGTFLTLRVRRIRALFEAGEEVEATVAKVSRWKGGSKLALRYERSGTAREVRTSFQRSARIPEFAVGDRVTLLVERRNPRNAVPIVVYGDGVEARIPADRDPLQRPAAVPWPVKAFGRAPGSSTSRSARKSDAG